jgi:hypothetical protein
VETTFPLPILCGLLCLVSVASAADFIVSNANVNGPGSLAQAIIEANGRQVRIA